MDVSKIEPVCDVPILQRALTMPITSNGDRVNDLRVSLAKYLSEFSQLLVVRCGQDREETDALFARLAKAHEACNEALKLFTPLTVRDEVFKTAVEQILNYSRNITDLTADVPIS